MLVELPKTLHVRAATSQLKRKLVSSLNGIKNRENTYKVSKDNVSNQQAILKRQSIFKYNFAIFRQTLPKLVP